MHILNQELKLVPMLRPAPLPYPLLFPFFLFISPANHYECMYMSVLNPQAQKDKEKV
jgi:hypothetical protein